MRKTESSFKISGVLADVVVMDLAARAPASNAVGPTPPRERTTLSTDRQAGTGAPASNMIGTPLSVGSAANDETYGADSVLQSKPSGPSSTALSLRVLSTLQIVIASAFASIWLLMSKAVQRTTDFPAFLAGWNLLVHGHGRQLYNLDAQKLVQQKLIGGSFANGVLPFVNPPYVATLFGALGRLSLGVGYWVWAAMNVGLLLILVSLLRKIVCVYATVSTAQWRRYLLWALAAAPVWSTLMGGTFSLWVCVGVAGFVLAMQEEREFSAGVWWRSNRNISRQFWCFSWPVVHGGRSAVSPAL
jgi:hypothetical protein